MAKKLKAAQTGSITELRNGRFWARGPLDATGKQPSLGTFATREEAEKHLEAVLYLQAHAHEIVGDKITFGTFAAEVLKLREDEGVRGVDQERDRFEFHLEKSSIASMPLTKIRPAHIAELGRALMRKDAADKRGRRKLSRRTVQRCLSIVSIVFREAVQRGLVETNPCAGVGVRRRASEGTQETWTYLTPDEQESLATCEQIPIADRLIIRCALGTGIREGELISNYLADLHLDGPEPYLLVRYGSHRGGVGLPPKSGKTRRVPLFGNALDAFRQWVEIRKTYIRQPVSAEIERALKSGEQPAAIASRLGVSYQHVWKVQKHGVRKGVRTDAGLIFPTVTGCRRAAGKPLGNGWKNEKTGDWVDPFKHACALAGIAERPGLYWHCLRHTCATSLLEGWWGHPWALEEVQQMLGHSSIQVTQRYAHHAGTRLRSAAARMRGASDALVTTTSPPTSATAVFLNDSDGSHLRDLNSRPTVYECAEQINHDVRLTPIDPSKTPPRNYSSEDTLAALAASFLDLVRRGQGPAAVAIGVTIANAILIHHGAADEGVSRASRTARRARQEA
jgi:integrase